MSDIEQARKYWRLGQDQKAIDVLDVEEFSTSAEALNLLGRIYENAGERPSGLSRSVTKAIKYWKEAVKFGSVHAALELADLYYSGDGVKENYSNAEKYWLIAVDRDDSLAKFKLADFYAHDKKEKILDAITLFESLESDEDFSRASCRYLGRIYNGGFGVQRDPTLAVSWFHKAAALKDYVSHFQLSVLYYRGEGVKQDIDKALTHAEKAAESDLLEDEANEMLDKMRNGTF